MNIFDDINFLQDPRHLLAFGNFIRISSSSEFLLLIINPKYLKLSSYFTFRLPIFTLQFILFSAWLLKLMMLFFYIFICSSTLFSSLINISAKFGRFSSVLIIWHRHQLKPIYLYLHLTPILSSLVFCRASSSGGIINSIGEIPSLCLTPVLIVKSSDTFPFIFILFRESLMHISVSLSSLVGNPWFSRILFWSYSCQCCLEMEYVVNYPQRLQADNGCACWNCAALANSQLVVVVTLRWHNYSGII